MEHFDGNVAAQTMDTPVDYYSILNAMHVERLKSLDITDLVMNSTKSELSDGLCSILAHSRQLLQDLSWLVHDYPHIPTSLYSNAVTRIITTILKDVPIYLASENLDTEQLAKPLAEYFNFMGVLYDHLSDSDIPYEVKANITEYYVRYVKTENSV